MSRLYREFFPEWTTVEEMEHPSPTIQAEEVTYCRFSCSAVAPFWDGDVQVDVLLEREFDGCRRLRRCRMACCANTFLRIFTIALLTL